MLIKRLPIPQEPIEVKKELKEILNRPLGKATIKQSTWIAAPLWKDAGWGKILKAHNINWQKFMTIVREHYYYWLDWIEDRKSWREVMIELIKHVEREGEK